MTVRLLHYSDLEYAFDDPANVARVAAAVAGLRDERTLVLGTGNNTAPSVLGIRTGGRQALDFFNAVDTDYETFGNHDFDHGVDTTVGLVRDAPNEWLTANVYDDESLFGSPYTASSAVTAVDGHRVGLVGVTTAKTTTNPRAASLTVTDPIDAAVEAVAGLRDEDVEFVVVLAHVGDAELATAVDADVVLDGHVHAMTTSTHDGTQYVRSGGGGTHVTEVELTPDDPPRVRIHAVDEAAVGLDAALEAALERRIADTGLDEVVATLRVPVECGEAAVNCGESPIGNFVTDALRRATGADVAVVPAGGFRVGPPLVGEVTAFDLHRLAPFDDEFCVVECTGEDLLNVVPELALVDREAACTAGDAVSTSHFGHVSGMVVVWDDARDTVRELRVDDEVVEADATYTLATIDCFLDRTLSTLDRDDAVETYRGEHPFVAYARGNGIDHETDGRIHRPALDE